MMQIIRCTECGNENIPMGVVSVDVNLSKSTWCEHCYESKRETQHHFFCTVGCLVEYMKKVLDGQAKLEWTD